MPHKAVVLDGVCDLCGPVWGLSVFLFLESCLINGAQNWIADGGSCQRFHNGRSAFHSEIWAWCNWRYVLFYRVSRSTEALRGGTQDREPSGRLLAAGLQLIKQLRSSIWWMQQSRCLHVQLLGPVLQVQRRIVTMRWSIRRRFQSGCLHELWLWLAFHLQRRLLQMRLSQWEGSAHGSFSTTTKR